MRVISSIDYSILEVDGKIRYRLNEPFTYHSMRYGKDVTVDTRYLSDGATGAPDISSRSWWVHDQLCETGEFDDGTKCSNWQASQILQDIMVEESPPRGWERYRPSSRWWESKRWFWATWLIGGGQARKNGMFKVAAAALLLAILSGCSTVNCNFTGDNNMITIEVPKTVTTSPAAALTTGDNTIPASIVP